MSKVRECVVVVDGHVAMGVKDPNTGQEMVLLMSPQQAHEMGVALCEGAWVAEAEVADRTSQAGDILVEDRTARS
jgi:hypothetical protein